MELNGIVRIGPERLGSARAPGNRQIADDAAAVGGLPLRQTQAPAVLAALQADVQNRGCHGEGANDDHRQAKEDPQPHVIALGLRPYGGSVAVFRRGLRQISRNLQNLRLHRRTSVLQGDSPRFVLVLDQDLAVFGIVKVNSVTPSRLVT